MKKIIVLLSILALIPWYVSAHTERLKTFVTYREQGPRLTESVSAGGRLNYAAFSRECKTDVDRQRAIDGLPPLRKGKGNQCRLLSSGSVPNAVPNAGRTTLLDGMAASSFDFPKFQGWGTSNQATDSTDTGCVAEATTQYTTTRGSGTKSVNGFVLSVVATTNFDQNITVQEFCLMSAATDGTVWTRIVLPSSIVNPSSIVGTYELTVN